jgi:hypothetical protein
MSLDINQVINQVQKMADYFKLQYGSKGKKLDFALEVANSEAANLPKLNKRIVEAKTTWLIPGLRESINSTSIAGDCPYNHVVMATDGSHIDVNRHQSAHCFLINTGSVLLQYGDNPSATLFNRPVLYYKDEDVVIASRDNKQVPIEGQLLGVKRNVEETRALIEMVKQSNDKLPILALLDGTLILWVMAEKEYQDYIIDNLISQGFVSILSEFHQAFKDRSACLASYISYPGSKEVVNALRMAICPYESVNCDKHCTGPNIERPCDKVAGLTDRDIFNKMLKEGERSALFDSRSSIVDKYYGDNKICFFYIKLEDEVCRVEIPEWIADSRDMVDYVHAVVLRQCELGFGYPVALMEAHEQAVVTGSDREQFWQLVEQISSEDLTEVKTSAKQWSKKIRWV